MNDAELWTLLSDSLQGTEASGWQKAALELNRRLVVAQVEASDALVNVTKATARSTYALVAATFAVALFSVIQAVVCLAR